jgi:hypothetical protein
MPSYNSFTEGPVTRKQIRSVERIGYTGLLDCIGKVSNDFEIKISTMRYYVSKTADKIAHNQLSDRDDHHSATLRRLIHCSYMSNNHFAESEHHSSYFVCIPPSWISYSSSKKIVQKFQFLNFNLSFPFSKSSCVLALRLSLAMFCAFSTKLDALVEELPEAGCPVFCVQGEITSYESALVRCLVASLS